MLRVLLIISVVSYSAFPVLFKLGDAHVSPFLFTGIHLLALGISGLQTMLHLHRDGSLPLRPAAIIEVMKGWGWFLMLVSVIGNCGFVMFALGLAFVDVSVAAILYETWPYFLILMLGTRGFFDVRKSIGTLIFAFPLIAGIALVIFSNNDTALPLLANGENFATPQILLGVFLVLMAVVSKIATVIGILILVHFIVKRYSDTNYRKEDLERVFIMGLTVIWPLIAGGLLCVIGLTVSESVSLHQLILAILSGLVVSIVVVIDTLRMTNSKTTDFHVTATAMACAIPLIALGLISVLSTIDVPHLDYLIIGAMGVVISNLHINTRIDKRINALVWSLWLFGTVIYLTEGYEPHIPLDTKIPLELSFIVFTLVVTFRIDRLVRRTSQEEEWMFEVFRRLESLATKGKIHNDAWIKPLLKIDQHEDTTELRYAYESLAEYLENEAMNLKKIGMESIVVDEITSTRHLVDKLAHSRQQSANFGELIAIALTGGLIVIGLLSFNRDLGLYGDLTSLLLSSVVVFLFVNIHQLQNDRNDKTLKRVAKRYLVNFENIDKMEGQPETSLVISAVTMILVIVSVFAGLFAGLFAGA